MEKSIRLVDILINSRMTPYYLISLQISFRAIISMSGEVPGTE